MVVQMDKKPRKVGVYMKNKIICLLSVVLMLIFTGCDKTVASNDYALKINGIEISKAEVYTYLFETFNSFETVGGSDIWDTDFDGQTAEAVAIGNTLNSIKTVKLAVEQSNKLGVALSDEEKATAATDAETFLSTIPETAKNETGITLDVVEIVMREKMIYAKVHQKITESYVPSEADFESYFEQQKTAYINNYTKLSVKSILIDKKEDAEYSVGLLRNGEPFYDPYNEFNNNEINPDGDIERDMYKGIFETQINIADEILQGDVLGPFEVTEGYKVFVVEKVTPPMEEEVRTLCRADYEPIMQQKVFSGEYSAWDAAAKVEKNNEVWDSIKIKGVFN